MLHNYLVSTKGWNLEFYGSSATTPANGGAYASGTGCAEAAPVGVLPPAPVFNVNPPAPLAVDALDLHDACEDFRQELEISGEVNQL